jgi:hypothetical protein
MLSRLKSALMRDAVKQTLLNELVAEQVAPGTFADPAHQRYVEARFRQEILNDIKQRRRARTHPNSQETMAAQYALAQAQLSEQRKRAQELEVSTTSSVGSQPFVSSSRRQSQSYTSSDYGTTAATNAAVSAAISATSIAISSTCM